MAFTCSTAFNQRQVNGFLERDVSMTLAVRQQQNCFRTSNSVLGKNSRPCHRQGIVGCATMDENIPERDIVSTGKDADANSSPSVASSPFVGAKISSRMAAKSNIKNDSKSKASSLNADPVVIPSSQISTSDVFKGSFNPSQQVSGVDKLKISKPSVFLDSKRTFKQPGPRDLLNTLRQSEIDGSKVPKFGQPVVPNNLFDEPQRNPAEEEKKFEFSFNAGQLVLIFSFLTIISIMLGTAFLVWKVGGIHYNEY